jgi:hypothetical protein
MIVMLPERIQVKVMSDSAGYIETTRVANREIPFAQLLDLVVAVAGLDAARIRTILRAGTAANASYRYRWAPIHAEEPEIAAMLGRFPQPDPARPFDASRCLLARIRAGVETIELPRDVASLLQRGQKQSFWDVLMDVALVEIAKSRAPRYETYSHRDGADIYLMELDPATERVLKQAAPLLAVNRTAEQVSGLPLERVTMYVKR